MDSPDEWYDPSRKMHYKGKEASHDPMYREIADQLRQQIESGEFKPARSCRPSRTSRRCTARPATPSGTRSSNSLPSDWSKPGPARALSSPPSRSIRHHSDRQPDRGTRRGRGCQLRVRGRTTGPNAIGQLGAGRDPGSDRGRCQRPVGTGRHRSNQPDLKRFIDGPLVAGDFLLPGRVRRPWGRPAPPSPRHRGRHRQLPPGHRWRPAGRRPRLDRRPGTEQSGDGLLQAAAGRASQRGRDIPDRL